MQSESFIGAKENILISAIWWALIFALFLLAASSFIGVPGRDSSAFIYVAQGLLSGEFPYVDRWDHKPPLIYVFDSLGLLLSGGAIWGIWVVESAFLAASILIGYSVLQKYFGTSAAAFSICVFLVYFYRFAQGGNLTEEYVLLFHFISIYLFIRINPERAALWSSLAIGALSAGAFLLKPNLVGLWLGIGLYWLFFATKFIRHIAGAVLGAALAFLLLFVVLLSVGAWTAFIDSVFSYNFAFSGMTTITEKIYSALLTSKKLDILSLVLTGWFVGIGFVLLQNNAPEPYRRLLYLALITFPIELVLIATSGRAQSHYYLTLLPVAAILLAFFGRTISETIHLFRQEKTSSDDSGHSARIISTLLLFAIVANTVSIYQGNYQHTLSGVMTMFKQGSLSTDGERKVADKIINMSSLDSSILVWGAQAQIYLLSGRKAPTRFFYQYALVTPNYASERIFTEFLVELERDKPEIIVDTKNARLPPLDKGERIVWEGSRKNSRYTYSEELFAPFFALVKDDYRFIEKINGYSIYKRK